MMKGAALEKDFSDLVGLSYEGARARATGRGIRTLRVASRGGFPCAGTRDYRTDRLNVDMDANDRVCAIRGLG